MPEPMHPGGLVTGPATTIRLERLDPCPHGHRQVRIDGSPYVEHLLTAAEAVEGIRCPYVVRYQPREDPDA